MRQLNHSVVLLYGEVKNPAPADEKDVLVQVETVAQTLTALGYRCRRLPLSLDLQAARRVLRSNRPLLVFNLVESIAGKGQYIHLAPALLEELGLAFTGASLQATFLCSNKLIAKQWLSRAGLPTPAWQEAGAGVAGPGPWLVKSVWEHASVGLEDDSLVTSTTQADAVCSVRQQRYGGAWFVERFIDGREFNLALLEYPDGHWQVLPAAEIVFEDYPADKPKILNYASKWQENAFEYRHTPRRFEFAPADRTLLGRLEALALQCIGLFQLNGAARVDFRIDAGGRPWILEVNTNPCLSPDAGFMAAAARAGLDDKAVIGRLVQSAMRNRTFPSIGTGYRRPAA